MEEFRKKVIDYLKSDRGKQKDFDDFLYYFRQSLEENYFRQSLEEKKTLSDKKTNMSMETGWQYQEKDVKEALKEFIDWLEKQGVTFHPTDVPQKTKEIFGERLIE